MNSSQPPQSYSLDSHLKNAAILSWLTKICCFSTLLLIFIGGLVKSTESGLAVPDWPLSYGMVFPPMVGGVLYEHGHRMAATLVGFFILVTAVLLACWEPRRWVKVLGFVALGTVIFQGILGGITVLYYLPTPVSVAHGVLAQTLLLVTILLAYSQSVERGQRLGQPEVHYPWFVRSLTGYLILVYLQLIIGAVMRHTQSGLAIPDFPTMGGAWWPQFDQEMLRQINDRRFDLLLDPVTFTQVWLHFWHRLGALVLSVGAGGMFYMGIKLYRANPLLNKSLRVLLILLATQILLGAWTVISHKEPYITSLHVVVGAAYLAWVFVLILRAGPVSAADFKQCLLNNSSSGS